MFLPELGLSRDGLPRVRALPPSPIQNPPPSWGWVFLLPPPAAQSARKGGPTSDALGRPESVRPLPALHLALSSPPPWDHHLLCRRGKVLEIRGLAVSAKEKQFS